MRLALLGSRQARPATRRGVALRRRVVGAFARAGATIADRTERPRAFVAPVTSVLSPAAWALFVVLLVGGVLGSWLRWDELRVAAFFAVFLLVGCLVFIIGGRHLSADLDLSRTRVVVGERATGRLLLGNPGGRRLLPLSVELPVGAGCATFDLPSLGPGAHHEELFAIPTHRRAILDLGPVRAVRSDPFGLLRRDRELTEPDLLHVHPRTVRLEGSASGFIRDLEGQTIRKLSDHDVAFHALREYVPGDDRRFIHWKSSARTGTLMVRQFEETRRSHLLVAITTRIDDYVSADEFELAVSVAASLGAQTLRDGHTLSAMTSTRHLRGEHATLLLDQYSGVEVEPRAPRMNEALRRLGRDVTGASVAILVCGSLVDAAELRRTRRLLPLDVRTIVVRCDLGAETSLRRMADLDVAGLGELDDLPGMMRRLAS